MKERRDGTIIYKIVQLQPAKLHDPENTLVPIHSSILKMYLKHAVQMPVP